MFLLAGCIESVAVIGTGATNGKMVQSSLQTGLSYGVKETTGKTPFGHAVSYVKKKKISEKQDSCSSFVSKKSKKLCLMLKKKITASQAKIKEKKLSNKPSKKLNSSLQSSIDQKSKIKYLDR